MGGGGGGGLIQLAAVVLPPESVVVCDQTLCGDVGSGRLVVILAGGFIPELPLQLLPGLLDL